MSIICLQVTENTDPHCSGNTWDGRINRTSEDLEKQAELFKP